MSDKKIEGGYILLSRKLIESEIMKKPPLYLKVWIWLLLKAQHHDYRDLKRGEYKTSIPEIIEAMSYKVGYRISRPTKKEIFGILEWLRNPYEGDMKGYNEGNMMVTTKVTHGFVYNIVNYSTYQNPDNYEGNNEGLAKVTTKVARRERQGNNTNKNDKNKEYIDVDEEQHGEIFKFFNQNISPISPHQAEVISNAIDLDNLAHDLILEILKDSLGKRDKWSWVKRVIDNCYHSGVKSLQHYKLQKAEKVQVKSRDAPKQTKTVSFADLAKEMQENDNAGNSSYYDDS